MTIPLRAVWPPLLLAVLDLVSIGIAWMLGWWPLALLLGLGLAILIFDIRSRGRDYRTVRDYLNSGRNPDHIAKSCQFSWCGRVACQAAADGTGDELSAAVRDYYRRNGYRWFHIFPDKTFSLRSPFLRLRFWRVTLFGNFHAAGIVRQGEPEIAPGPVTETVPGMEREIGPQMDRQAA